MQFIRSVTHHPGLGCFQGLLVDALIKANKTFDSLLVPDANHGLSQHPYVIRRTWDSSCSIYWAESRQTMSSPRRK